MTFIVTTFIIIVIVQLQTYSSDLEILDVVPLIFLSLCMIWSMYRIKTVVKLLNSDDPDRITTKGKDGPQVPKTPKEDTAQPPEGDV